MYDVLTLAKELIACPSVTPNDAGCQTLIQNYLQLLGFKCEAMRFHDVDNLWARIGDEAPLFVFAGHTDVVPPGPLSDWQSNPFIPTLRDGYLFGRGASDMKAALASMIVAATQFMHKNPVFKGSIAFLLTSDEEGPGLYGTKKVIETLEARKEKIDYCVIGEPSSIEHVGDQIRVGRRGSLHGKLTVHGKQGHVAHPHLAENPIHLSAKALHELAVSEWDKGNEYFPATTFQITNLNCGTGALNVIPGHLETNFNFRFGTASTIDELKKRVNDILSAHKLSFDLDWTIGAEPFLSKKANLIAATDAAIKEITGLKTILSTGGGTSDGRFIAKTGAEIVELGMTHATAHHINEHIRRDDLEILTRIYEKILARLFTS